MQRRSATNSLAAKVSLKSGLVRAILVAMMTAVAIASPTAAQAGEVTARQDGCTRWEAQTPYVARDQFGAYVVGPALWSCSNAPGIVTHIIVELYRDGNLHRRDEYNMYGAFTQTFSATVACPSPQQGHFFRTETLGFDGLPTSYLRTVSPEVWLICP